MNHIELFAGCGGLSLGLEEAGFNLLLANELSPMAAETFAFNFLNEDFESLAKSGCLPEKSLWITSNHRSLAPRLRENPFTYPEYSVSGDSILNTIKPQELKGKLLVGSIIELNRYLESSEVALEFFRKGFDERGGLDLVSGGPPCQSFSMAGKREKNNDKNSLPWEFARFVELTQPKIALLENVTGILRPFKGEDGRPYYAWYEVAKVFASIGYVPLCLHINARHAGVAQNRPRFIMLALREDFASRILIDLPVKDQSLFEQPLEFYEKARAQGASLEFGKLQCIDTQKAPETLSGTFLGDLIACKDVSVKDAIDDLKFMRPAEPSTFVKQLNARFKSISPAAVKIRNHEQRRNSDTVRRRFRLYQVLQEIGNNEVKNDIFNVLKGQQDTISDKAWAAVEDFAFMLQDDALVKFGSKEEFSAFLRAHPTKKQTQKALDPLKPAPAALSIPDDACHYDSQELRVLTVREMARIQSFPDGFEFRSKVTTGGKMRRFEVPQYTQVGNAVPPLLGLKLGSSIRKLLLV